LDDGIRSGACEEDRRRHQERIKIAGAPGPAAPPAFAGAGRRAVIAGMEAGPRERPDPDALLRRLQERERLERRAQLKIFFGAVAGVGKTYAMLAEAHELRRAGADVVVGLVETHGRPETQALLEGLEVLPRREVEYRGVRLTEFDLDAALGRRPGLVLVDELAHTNAPGGRHARRWQDVEELLTAGVDVATTLNVQHVESLNDVVERLTGVFVRETVPDSILDRADVIELVDLPPDDLLQRLREGKVYVPERAERALQNFFQKGNLIALRELALRRTADRVDAQRESWSRIEGEVAAASTGGRLVVALGDLASGPALVRAGRRMADRLRVPWVVAHVQTPASLRAVGPERERLSDVMGFAEDLGAETAVLQGQDVAAEVLAYARDRQAARLLVGRSRRPAWLARLAGSTTDALLRGAREIEVIVAGAEPAAAAGAAPAPAPARRSHAADYARALGIVVAVSLVALPLRDWLEPSNLAMLYLLGVAVAATTCGRGPSVAAAILSVATFDFVFVPPYLTFAVTDVQYLVTFVVMLAVALALSTLALRLREQAELARGRERRTAALHRLTRDLAGVPDEARMGESIVRAVSETFGGPAMLLLPGERGRLAARAGDAAGFGDATHELGVAQWAFDHDQPAGRGTDTLPSAFGLYLPMSTAGGLVGVLGMRLPEASPALAPDALRFLQTFARQAAISLERARLADEAERARVETETERARSALLASVSHDLRTPLAVITGTATTLLAPDAPASGETRRELLATIAEESARLGRLVEDLLEMTRLEAGVPPNLEWVPVEELVGSALGRTEAVLRAHDVRVAVEPGLPLVRLDEVLLTQALVHLLENAARHTPPGTAVEVAARRDGEWVAIEVGDRGPGLAPGDEARVFDKFWRAEGAGEGARDDGARRGTGLGLAICRAIVEAHGGRVEAARRPGGGARFTLRLPVSEAGPAAPPAEEVRDERDAAG
jgi:two-component system sensor histidine kinase KdpD